MSLKQSLNNYLPQDPLLHLFPTQSFLMEIHLKSRNKGHVKVYEFALTGLEHFYLLTLSFEMCYVTTVSNLTVLTGIVLLKRRFSFKI